jgi:hypothetical protein
MSMNLLEPMVWVLGVFVFGLVVDLFNRCDPLRARPGRDRRWE